MKSKRKLWEICMDIYRQMYREATPPADLDELIKKGETKKTDWFLEYYLPTKRQEEIIDFHTKKNKLTGWEKRKVSQEIWLGCSPTGVRGEKDD